MNSTPYGMSTPDIIHCTGCGKEMNRTAESAKEWCKIRRCKECKGLKSHSEYKHCRACGRKITFIRYIHLLSYLETNTRHKTFESLDNIIRSWSTRVYYEKCDPELKKVEDHRKEQLVREKLFRVRVLAD